MTEEKPLTPEEILIAHMEAEGFPPEDIYDRIGSDALIQAMFRTGSSRRMLRILDLMKAGDRTPKPPDHAPPLVEAAAQDFWNLSAP